MRKNINILLSMLAIFFVQSCSEELIVDDVISGVESGGVLRNLGETNDLDIEVMTSTYSIILEAQDAQGGSLLSEVRVNVGYNDNDDTGIDTMAVSLFSTIPAASFNETSPTTNNLPVATFSTTLADLMTHVGASAGDIASGDAFVIDFEMVLTDGRIFNLGNATGDVTRTGRFSYFNSQFRYTATIGDPQRLVLEDLSVADDNGLGILREDDVDTVFLTFDRSDAFAISPTITRLSTAGETDDTIGPLVQLTGDDDDIYYFLYTAGEADADTISFVVADAATTAGLPIPTDTLKSAYFIDNVAPMGMLGDRSVSLNDTSFISSVSVELLFTEELGQDTVDFYILSTQLDTIAVNQVITEGSTSLMVDFTPTLNGMLLPEGGLDFTIRTDSDTTAGGGIIDLVGNQMSREYDVTIFD